MALDIPVPTASPQDDPAQYIPLVLSAVEGFLLARDVWAESDYLEAYNYMQELMEYLVLIMEGGGGVMQVGAIVMWTLPTLPNRWLKCDGSAYLKTAYSELFALFGGRYGESETYFGVPDMTFRSPFGANIETDLDVEAGELEHTLTVGEIPAHSHNIKIGQAAGSGAHPHTNNNQASQSTSYAAIAEAGGGGSHNNLHPVYGVYYIVYAGKT